MRIQYAGRGVLVLVALLGAGCDERLSDLTGPTRDLTPTFASIQREILESTDSSGRTGCTQCHTDQGRTPAAGLNLRHEVAYSQLVGAPSSQKAGAVRVVPGEPENSYLVHKLEGRSDIVGLRMPRNTGPFLTAGQMQVLNRWIALGAPNN